MRTTETGDETVVATPLRTLHRSKQDVRAVAGHWAGTPCPASGARYGIPVRIERAGPTVRSFPDGRGPAWYDRRVRDLGRVSDVPIAIAGPDAVPGGTARIEPGRDLASAPWGDAILLDTVRSLGLAGICVSASRSGAPDHEPNGGGITPCRDR